jgi:hypothetical protein
MLREEIDMEEKIPNLTDTLSKVTEQRVRDHKRLSEDWALVQAHIKPMVADPEIQAAMRRINTEIFLMPIEDAIFMITVTSERLGFTSIFGDFQKQFDTVIGKSKSGKVEDYAEGWEKL